jgi:hypothetical protein
MPAWRSSTTRLRSALVSSCDSPVLETTSSHSALFLRPLGNRRLLGDGRICPGLRVVAGLKEGPYVVELLELRSLVLRTLLNGLTIRAINGVGRRNIARRASVTCR